MKNWIPEKSRKMIIMIGTIVLLLIIVSVLVIRASKEKEGDTNRLGNGRIITEDVKLKVGDTMKSGKNEGNIDPRKK